METNRENWRSVDGYANYEVSGHGRVRNATTERIEKASKNSHGYHLVKLYRQDKVATLTVHRLVAQGFIENTLNKPCVDHIDNNKSNNNVSNLRYRTHSQNGMNCSKYIS